MSVYLVRERLWRTKDGKIVPEGDPRAAFLFATPGMVLEEKPKVEKATQPDENKLLKPEKEDK